VKRWWTVIALLLSVGINIGLLTAVMARRATQNTEREQPPREARLETPRVSTVTAETPEVVETAETPKPPETPNPAETPKTTPKAAETPRTVPAAPAPPHGAAVVPPRPPLADRSGEDPLPKLRRLADHLGLEGETRLRFLEIQRRFFTDGRDRRMQIAETRRELRRELTAPQPDEARIQALLQEASRGSLALEQALARNVLETRRLLSPEQEREYLEIIRRLGPLAQPRKAMEPGARSQPGGRPGLRNGDERPQIRPRPLHPWRRRPPFFRQRGGRRGNGA
jgi:hypothetical protein